jgi:hypothetical protein
MNPFDVAVAAIIFGSITTMVTSYTRMRSRRAESESVSGPSEERLERIEAAVDAIAAEVERLGESQRFTERLIAGRTTPAAVPGSRERGM